MGLTANALQLLATTGGATAGLVASVSRASAERGRARAEAAGLATARRVTEAAAADVARRGREEEAKIRARSRRLRGGQRAAIAAQGIDVESGTAALLQAETLNIGALDAITTRNNAMRQAVGLRMEAEQLRAQERLVRGAGRGQARATLLTGGLRFISQTGGAIGEFSKDPHFTEAARERTRERQVFQTRLTEGERPRSRIIGQARRAGRRK